MDLTEEQAQELFPDDRGDHVDDAEVESWIDVVSGPDALHVGIDDEMFPILPEDRDGVCKRLAEELDLDEAEIWDLFRDRDVTLQILREVTEVRGESPAL